MPTKKSSEASATEDEGIILLSPTRATLKVKGKLSYCESDQAWNLLRLKKELLHEFPYLRDKRGEFIYLMKLHRSHEELKKELELLQANSSIVPIMLFIGKEKSNDD